MTEKETLREEIGGILERHFYRLQVFHKQQIVALDDVSKQLKKLENQLSKARSALLNSHEKELQEERQLRKISDHLFVSDDESRQDE